LDLPNMEKENLEKEKEKKRKRVGVKPALSTQLHSIRMGLVIINYPTGGRHLSPIETGVSLSDGVSAGKWAFWREKEARGGFHVGAIGGKPKRPSRSTHLHLRNPLSLLRTSCDMRGIHIHAHVSMIMWTTHCAIIHNSRLATGAVLIYIYIYIYIETAILNITLKYIAEGKGNSEPHSLRLLLVCAVR